MEGWTRHAGTAIALPIDAIDTDMLIPARFMSRPRAEGYGDVLLRDLRAADRDNPLDATPGASVLVAGRDFGVGSSREAAVYALIDAGFRVVIAASFGDIFAANAVNNGLLPLRLREAEAILDRMGRAPSEAVIDLDGKALEITGLNYTFHIDAASQEKLRLGLDDIDLTARHAEEIARFAAARRETAPWAWPGPSDAPDPRREIPAGEA